MCSIPVHQLPHQKQKGQMKCSGTALKQFVHITIGPILWLAVASCNYHINSLVLVYNEKWLCHYSPHKPQALYMKRTNYKVVFKEKCCLFFDRVYLTYRKLKWVRRTVRTDTSSHWESGWACKWVWARVLKESDGVSRSCSLMFMNAGGGAGVGGCLWNENGSLAEHRTLCCPKDQFTDLLAESLSELATPALRGVEDKL